MQITPEEISKIIGSPIENVRKYWPLIIAYLQKRNKNTLAFQVALLATIGVECGQFRPVKEWFPPSWTLTRAMRYFNDAYSYRKDLGNLGGDDGWKYRGAGFIQLTGRANFKKYGALIGVDLEKYPQYALIDENAVAILVEYAITHGLDVWAARAYNVNDDFAEEESWRKVRLLVNGGYNHYDKFRKFVTAFKEAGVN